MVLAAGLCANCGLCCDGSLFGTVEIVEEDADRMHDLGVVLTPCEDDNYDFDQPCPMLKGTRCTIYAQRPETCSDFRCTTLRELDAGEIALDQAQDRVATVRQMLADLTRHDRRSYQELRAQWADEKLAGADAMTTALLNLGMESLNRYLDRHFRRGEERVYADPDDLEISRP